MSLKRDIYKPEDEKETLNNYDQLLEDMRETKRELDSNKLHRDRLKEMLEHATEEDAMAAIETLSKKHWDKMFSVLEKRFGTMLSYYATIRQISDSNEFQEFN